ncbi:MAG: class I SAM-dependent methyltransferase [Acidimicrobiales bacterium]
MTEPDWAALDAAWQPARKAGVLGSATTDELIVHAAGYLPAACRVADEFSGADLGTGAGVPGVVLAALRPASRWLLVDASERRCEFAQAAVRALGLSERVTVRHARAEEVAHDVLHRASCALVVARSFGTPGEVAECGLPLLAGDGRLVVSVVAATMEIWMSAASDLGLTVEPRQGNDGAQYVEVQRPALVPDEWPRRPAARRRTPLL